MGLPWIELHTDLPDHPKSLALAESLGDERAWTHMAQLWLYCARNAPDGIIKGIHAVAMVERASGWKGQRGQLYRAAKDAGFLEDGEAAPANSEPVLIVVHGWADRASAHIAKQQRDAERQRTRRERIAKRFGGKASDVSHADVTRTSRPNPPESHRNSNPNPNPNPLPSEEKEAPAAVAQETGLGRIAEKPDRPADAWDGTDFFQWAQHIRQKSSLVPEKPNNPRQVGAWWSSCLQTPGVTAEAMKRGFYAFGKDPYWEVKGFPFNGFLKTWERYVRTEVANAAHA